MTDKTFLSQLITSARKELLEKPAPTIRQYLLIIGLLVALGVAVAQIPPAPWRWIGHVAMEAILVTSCWFSIKRYGIAGCPAALVYILFFFLLLVLIAFSNQERLFRELAKQGIHVDAFYTPSEVIAVIIMFGLAVAALLLMIFQQFRMHRLKYYKHMGVLLDAFDMLRDSTATLHDECEALREALPPQDE